MYIGVPMKPKFNLLLWLACVPMWAPAQTTDVFNDGNFQHPEWKGDTISFAINSSEQLQLKASQAGDYYVSTALPGSSVQEWQFWVRNAFSPSTQNFMRFYLLSDTPFLTGAVNGYYIQLGGVTGNTDSITLYRQTGMERRRIAAGRPATVAKTNNRIRLKILRNHADWIIYSDTGGGTQFSAEATAQDGMYLQGTWMGMYCKTTTGNVQNFYLDDVYAGPEQKDTVPPQLLGVETIEPNQIKLLFSEVIDTANSINPMQFTVNPGNSHPQKMSWEFPDPQSVVLTFDSAFQNKQTYQIDISGLSDTAGNVLNASGISFTFFSEQLYDVLIAEFMADPSPPADLPEQEFVELYNASGISLNLEGWTISDGSSTATFPLCSLASGERIIACPFPVQSQFEGYGRVVGLNNFPSLNNSGDELILRSRSGKIIHHLEYTKDWYANPEKAEGGWSLEMINPYQACQCADNYQASRHPAGGTPGQINSVWQLEKDTAVPQLIAVHIIDSVKIVLRFNETMDSLSIMQSEWQIAPEIAILNRKVSGVGYDSLWLTTTEFQHRNFYSVTGKGVRDCNGNEASAAFASFEFLKTETAQWNDVVISEIMADPEGAPSLPAFEFIELYNRSDKVISLEGWTFWSGTAYGTFGKWLLKPDSFLVITAIENESAFPNPNTKGLPSFPLLANSGAQLVLRDATGRLMFQVRYSDTWYRNALKEKGGWSLEMTDLENPCGSGENWDASEDAAGGTPGKPNSIQLGFPDIQNPKMITVYPVDSLLIEVRFTETMHHYSMQQISNYTLEPNREILQAKPVEPGLSAMRLHLQQPLESATLYRLRINSGEDCAGNKLMPVTHPFTLPEPPEPGDLIINEILFNPFSDGSDFMEVVNRSDKWIDLKNVLVANAREEGGIGESENLAPEGWLLNPGAYLVFAVNPADIRQRYFVPENAVVLPCDLPGMNDDEGTVILVQGQQVQLDEITYAEKMHYPLLDNPEGVSLERISLHRPSQDPTNWSSAASTSGYATPGYINSQHQTATQVNGIMQVEPLVFSPDNDGYRDQVHFQFQFPASGYSGTVHIFNDAGLLIKTLLHNSLMGVQSSLSWNGLDEEGKLSASGIYLVYLEAFNLNGKVVQEKKAFALGVRF